MIKVILGTWFYKNRLSLNYGFSAHIIDTFIFCSAIWGAFYCLFCRKKTFQGVELYFRQLFVNYCFFVFRLKIITSPILYALLTDEVSLYRVSVT